MDTPDNGRISLRIRSLADAAALVFFFAFLIFCLSGIVEAQSAPQAATSSSETTDKNAPEMASIDVPATFKVNVKLVVVRVVARDSQGHAIGKLQQQDFQVFDNGKPQTITQFSVEKAGTHPPTEANGKNPANPASSTNGPSDEPGETVKAAAMPQRYTAYLFDDVHLKTGDLTYARQAAERHLALLQPTDRAAIFSTSGQTVLDFTDDHARLQDTLLALRSRPVATGGVANPCPDVSYYMADLIVNKQDEQALQTATLETLDCAFSGDAQQMGVARQMAQGAARRSLEEGEQESRLALGVLKDLIRRIALMPGQRTIVLVSPGFQTPQLEYAYAEIIDRALHSEVIINAIDARGLYVPGAASDPSKPGSSNVTGAIVQTGRATFAAAPGGGVMLQEQKTLYDIASASADDDVLAVMTDGTGGTFFHNNNDLSEGFRLAAPPEYSYVLGFIPQNLKPDGSFHTLKVKLNGPLKLNLQTRRGYFAARHLDDPAEEAKHEIEDAVFSQAVLHGLPVELRTQFYKSSDHEAKLSVLAVVDVKRIHFRKAEGRNRNDLTLVSALFDRNGNYLEGVEKVLHMSWKDETLERRLGSGITVKTGFDVKPGTYRVRLIVRDTEGQLMSAENSAVEIP
jgi:VWFA-related protein